MPKPKATNHWQDDSGEGAIIQKPGEGHAWRSKTLSPSEPLMALLKSNTFCTMVLQVLKKKKNKNTRCFGRFSMVLEIFVCLMYLEFCGCPVSLLLCSTIFTALFLKWSRNCVSQAGLEFLGSNDPPASASSKARTADVHLCPQLIVHSPWLQLFQALPVLNYFRENMMLTAPMKTLQSMSELPCKPATSWALISLILLPPSESFSIEGSTICSPLVCFRTLSFLNCSFSVSSEDLPPPRGS